MSRLLDQWSAVARDYADAVSADEEAHDFFGAILVTLGTLSFALGAAVIIGGFHG